MDKSDIYVGDGVDLRIKDGIKNSLSTIIISPQIMHIQSGALMNVFSSLNATRTLGTLLHQFYMRLKSEILNTSRGIMVRRLNNTGQGTMTRFRSG